MNTEKKIEAIALALCFALLLALPLVNELPQSAIRLHVIANSDSPYDQALKLKVRDSIVNAMRPALSTTADKSRARTLLLENGETLQNAAEAALEAAGKPYGARLYFGDYEFPDRQYGDKVYPAGEYEAVRVVLGDGAGQNWWCVMFPPLCLPAVSVKSGNSVFSEPYFSKEASKSIESGKNNTSFRFAIYEWLESLFKK